MTGQKLTDLLTCAMLIFLVALSCFASFFINPIERAIP
jgi:hypothetical protein